MIPSFWKFNNKSLGSSCCPRMGGLGQGQHLFHAAHFAKQNTNPVGAKREGAAEGVWGIAAAPERESNRGQPRRPARSEQSNTKSFLFPFRRKNRRALHQEKRRKLFCGAVRVSRTEAGRLP